MLMKNLVTSGLERIKFQRQFDSQESSFVKTLTNWNFWGGTLGKK